MDPQGLGAPHAGADEDAGIAVPKELLDGEGPADGGVRPDLDAHLQHLFLIAGEHRLGEAELRDAVLHHAADLVLGLEDGDVVSRLGKADGDCHAGGTASDHRSPLSLGEVLGHLHAVQVGIRDELLDLREVHRTALAAQHAVAHALLLVVADGGADEGHGIVLEEHLPGLHQLVLLKELDHIGDRRMDGAALPAHRLLAVQAPLCLALDKYSHGSILLVGLGGHSDQSRLSPIVPYPAIPYKDFRLSSPDLSLFPLLCPYGSRHVRIRNLPRRARNFQNIQFSPPLQTSPFLLKSFPEKSFCDDNRLRRGSFLV